MNRLLLAFACVALTGIATPAQEPPPSIIVRCTIARIDPYPIEYIYTVDVKFSWEAKNCGYVYVEGYDDKRHPPKGHFIQRTGGHYRFIAVGKNGITTKTVCCVHDTKVSPRRRVIHTLVRDCGPSAGLYQTEPTPVITSLQKQVILSRLKALFQNRRYTTVSANHAAEDLLLYTREYRPQPALQGAGDCKGSADGRQPARQIAFSLWLNKLPRSKDGATYNLHILPSVMVNDCGKGAMWKIDPQGERLAFQASTELAREIAEKLKP